MLDFGNQEIKMVVTGGHHTSALAVISALKGKLTDRGNRLVIFWFGHRYSMKGDRRQSLEFKEVTALAIPFFDLKTARFYRNSRFAFVLLFVFGFLQSVFYLNRLRPTLVFAFGGYLSVPVVLAARLLHITTVTHEQTVAAGLANRFIARLCAKVFVSFPSSLKFFPPKKTVLTGNPVRPEVFVDRSLFKFKNEKKVIYITGGKQGAHELNQLVMAVLPKLLKDYNVIHQSGSSTVFDDWRRLNQFRQASLSPDQKSSYFLRDHFVTEEIGSVYGRADLVISRAGANTVYELALLRKPAILVPLAGSSYGEQEENARLLVAAGLAKILTRDGGQAASLLNLVSQLMSRSRGFGASAVQDQSLFLKDADQKIAEEILTLVVPG